MTTSIKGSQTEKNLVKAFSGESQARNRYTFFAGAAGKIGSTLENLKAAAAGEEHEWTELYPEFAKIAREEGFAQIAVAFERIAIAEKQHGKRYKDLAGNLEEGRVFARNGTATWRCINCGYLHEAAQAPQLCPACLHPQSYFELLGENW